ncbi:hypothetical protein [Azospirillum sp. sgz301742]
MTDPKIDPAPKAAEAETPVADADERSAPVRAAPRIDAPPLHAPSPATAPVPVERPPVSRARGGGMATFAALIALAAAGVSIAGPSLRPYLAEQLTARYGEHELIGILTGTAAPKPKNAVQLDLAAFDRRVEALAQALGGAPGGTAVDAATLATLTKALGQPLPDQGPSPEARKLADLEARVAALTSRLDERLAALEQSIGEAAAAAKSVGGELGARLSAAEQALAAAQAQGAGDLAALAERLTAVDRLVAGVDERSVSLAARSASAPLLALVTRIRFALEMSEPFAEEVSALSALAGDDPEARAALDSLNGVAAQGVANLPRLQRQLAPLLARIVESERAAGSSWYTRATSLFFWSAATPSRADMLSERVDAIARDMRGGQLSSALWKLRALEAPLGEGVQAWIAEANSRLAADQALRTLTGVAFRRAKG